MLGTARDALAGAGHEVVVSDLHEMRFDPVSGRHNFTTVKDPGYFKQQIEELHATEHGGFSPELDAEMRKLEAYAARLLAIADEAPIEVGEY